MRTIEIPMRTQHTTTCVQTIERDYSEVLLDLDCQTIDCQTIVFDGVDVTYTTADGRVGHADGREYPVYLTLNGEDVALRYENGAWVVMNDCEVLA